MLVMRWYKLDGDVVVGKAANQFIAVVVIVIAIVRVILSDSGYNGYSEGDIDREGCSDSEGDT